MATRPVMRAAVSPLFLALAAFVCMPAQSALFEDEEARRAILELRQRVETVRQEAEQRTTQAVQQAKEQSTEEATQLRRSLIDLQGQIEAMKADVARLRGQGEQLARDVAELQRTSKDKAELLEDRLRKLEPLKVTIDGAEFLAEPQEKRDFESALALFRKGDFNAAQLAFVDVLRRYPQSGYKAASLFWLGNAQYATRDYKEAIINFRALLAQSPDHIRAPEAVLSVANCQLELKDAKGAKKTLEDLVKAYPQSEAAAAARERLARLK
ncbi:MAG: hypothetical protein RLZZ591_297 [Pseudomonadota bacterium]|jgi:tol-pal system protein YbgF